MSIPESALSYGSVLTLSGENAEINGKLNNKSIEFTHIAIGDANDEYVQPSRTQTTLVNEITRIPVTGMEKIEPSEEGGIPQLKVWAKIPDDIVDVAVREFAAVAIYDGNSYLHAIGNTVRIPILSGANNGGEVNDIYIEMTFAVTSLEPIVMIDPAIVTATRKYVDDKDAAHVQAADPHSQYALKNEMLNQMDAHLQAEDPHDQYVLKDELETEAGRSDEIIKIITQNSNAKIYPEVIGEYASTDGDYRSPDAATHLIVPTDDGLKLVKIKNGPVTGAITSLDTTISPMTAVIGGTNYTLLLTDLSFISEQLIGIDKSWQEAEYTDTEAVFLDGTPKYRAQQLTFTSPNYPLDIIVTMANTQVSYAVMKVVLNGTDEVKIGSNTNSPGSQTITGSITVPPNTPYEIRYYLNNDTNLITGNLVDWWESRRK